MIIVNESSLRRQVASDLYYYHHSRCHLALKKDSPETTEVQPPDKGIVVEVPRVGGLHHRYERRAALSPFFVCGQTVSRARLLR
jgi:hypothetical protein